MAEKKHKKSIIIRAQKIIQDYNFYNLKKNGYNREFKEYGFATIFPPLKAMPKAKIIKSDFAFKDDISYELYIHYPFCTGKCTYCHFNVINTDKVLQKKYHEALMMEVKEVFSQKLKPRISSIYFGGGSPSLMSLSALKEIFDLLRACNISINDSKKTIELHPELIHQKNNIDIYLQHLKNLGFTNISIGVQDFNNDVLQKINRRHTKSDAIKIISLAKKYGFQTNIDLLINLPNQTIKNWICSLQTAFSLSLDQVSVYMTVLRPHMQMYWQYMKKTEKFPNKSELMVMYVIAQLIANDFSYEEKFPNLFFKKTSLKPKKLSFLKSIVYKVSDFFRFRFFEKKEKKSETNLIAVGAGVYGFINKTQFFNHPNINTYIKLINSEKNAKWRSIKLNKDLKILRDIIFGIRYGYFDLGKYKCLSQTIKNELDDVIKEYKELLLIDFDCKNFDKVKLTSKGKLFSDEMIRKIVPESIKLAIHKNDINGEKDVVNANNFFYELD